MAYDPDERFSLDLEPEEAVRTLLGVRGDPVDMEPEEQVEDDTEA